MITEKIKKFNDYIADKLSYILATMLTFYVITLLVILPLLYTQPTSIVAWASYLCSVIFQGIALPVLGYTARKSSDKSDKIINHMNKTTSKIEEMVIIMEKQQEQLIYLISIIEQKDTHISEEVDVIIEMTKK
jgi:lipopolysaccharide export LptBFGC system permease protein LptF